MILISIYIIRGARLLEAQNEKQAQCNTKTRDNIESYIPNPVAYSVATHDSQHLSNLVLTLIDDE